jgi:ribosome-binding factor A
MRHRTSMSTEGRRPERVGALIHQAVAALLLRGIKDPRVTGVTLTGVEVSPDLRHALVHYRVLGGPADRERAQAGLDRAAGFIKSAVGRELGLRHTPELRFAFDPTPEHAARLAELLEAARGGEEPLSDADDEHEDSGGRHPARR